MSAFATPPDRATLSPTGPALIPVPDLDPATSRALYIHLPWCVEKCPYCDFNSHGVRGAAPPFDDYVAALGRDIAFERGRQEAAGDTRPVTSVFFGGGTPSLFPARAIGAILEAANAAFPFAADAEITLEANPGTVDAGHFAGYRAAGVNRLSIGVQSLDDARLKILGRIHDRHAAVRAVEVARGAGFDNLNLDLMFGLPGQDLAGAEADLAALLELAPEHVSYYHLTLEPQTAFARTPPPNLPDSDLAFRMLDGGMERLAAAGFVQYETSAYARPGRASRHNRVYWTFADYIGVGAGAHGKLTWRGGANGSVSEGLKLLRASRLKHPKAYLRNAGTCAVLESDAAVLASDLPFEFGLNALRLVNGVPWSAWRQTTGLDDEVLRARLSGSAKKGLVAWDDMRLWPTKKGQSHLNAILTDLL